MKFFNQAGAIVYQPFTSTVRITFGDTGTLNEYRETLRIAEGMAQLHRATAYLIEKESFDHLSVSEYGQFLMDWVAQLNNQWQSHRSIAFVVPPSAVSAVREECQNHFLSFVNIPYEIVTSYSEAVRFLGISQL